MEIAFQCNFLIFSFSVTFNQFVTQPNQRRGKNEMIECDVRERYGCLEVVSQLSHDDWLAALHCYFTAGWVYNNITLV